MTAPGTAGEAGLPQDCCTGCLLFDSSPYSWVGMSAAEALGSPLHQLTGMPAVTGETLSPGSPPNLAASAPPPTFYPGTVQGQEEPPSQQVPGSGAVWSDSLRQCQLSTMPSDPGCVCCSEPPFPSLWLRGSPRMPGLCSSIPAQRARQLDGSMDGWQGIPWLALPSFCSVQLLLSWQML